jgi:hypothetical protein
MQATLLPLVLGITNLGAWIYGIYCYVQAFRFRRRGLPHYGLILTVDQLQPAGQQYLRRWAAAWLVGLGTSVLAALVL